MLRATCSLCESDAPLLQSLQLCSNYRSTVRSRHEHRPLHSLLGVWGRFSPNFYTSVAQPQGEAKHIAKFVSSINMN